MLRFAAPSLFRGLWQAPYLPVILATVLQKAFCRIFRRHLGQGFIRRGWRSSNWAWVVHTDFLFNLAWRARQTYRRNAEKSIDETICAENNEVMFDAAVSSIP